MGKCVQVLPKSFNLLTLTCEDILQVFKNLQNYYNNSIDNSNEVDYNQND